MATSVKKEDVKKVAEEVKEGVSNAAAAAAKTAEEAKDVVVENTKKATEETMKVAEKAKTAAEATVKKAKKAAGTKKRAYTKKSDITKTAILQFGGNDYKIDEIVANAQAAFKAENKRKTVKDIKVYIKPEERAAYYVVNADYAGRIDL